MNKKDLKFKYQLFDLIKADQYSLKGQYIDIPDLPLIEFVTHYFGFILKVIGQAKNLQTPKL